MESTSLLEAAITINDIGMYHHIHTSILHINTHTEILLEKTLLVGINVVDSELDKIFGAKTRIQAAADEILERGLATQNQSDLFEGLAVFFHLGMISMVHIFDRVAHHRFLAC